MSVDATTAESSLAGMPIATRQQTIAKARSQGLKIVAALPYHYPRALLRAHGFHTLEVWAPSSVPSDSGARHFQAYACAVVVKGAAFLLDGGFQHVDAVLIPHGCDALQGLGSVLRDFVGQRPPILTLYPPRGRRRVDADYLLAEYQQLGERLSAISGITPQAAEWQQAFAAEDAAEVALASLYARRAQLALNDREFYTAVRLREYLLPEDFVALVSRLPLGPRPVSGIPLLFSGILADPLALFELINEAGAYIAADDLSTGSRRMLPLSVATARSDPWQHLVERFMAGPADPTRIDPVASRIEHISALLQQSGARGVLVFDPTFCEPEQFYLPLLRQALERSGIPLLFVEHEATVTISGQTVSRIEAFIETLV